MGCLTLKKINLFIFLSDVSAVTMTLMAVLATSAVFKTLYVGDDWYLSERSK